MLRVSLDRFQALALTTTAATFLLIAVGGLVRASGAGLGCPDWPKCFDLWIPPMQVEQVPAHIDPRLFNFTKAWTEYLNRLLGVVVGILIFATLVVSVKKHRSAPRVVVPTAVAFVLVAFEGWLGGQVVAHQLAPLVLSAHLSVALVIVILLLYATVSAFFPAGRPPVPLSRDRKLLGRAALGVGLVVLLQIGLGALARGEVQMVDDALPRSEWLRAVGVVAPLHQNFAVLAALAVSGLVGFVFSRAEPDPWLRGTALCAIVLVALQVAAGVGLSMWAFPPVLQVLHLWFATALLGALTVLGLLAYRLDPRESRGVPPMHDR